MDAPLRGRGHGTAMMRWIADRVPPPRLQRIQLTSNKSRKAAHRFYARLGFHASHEGMKLDLSRIGDAALRSQPREQSRHRDRTRPGRVVNRNNSPASKSPPAGCCGRERARRLPQDHLLQQRLLHVQPVLRLVEDRGLRPLQHAAEISSPRWAGRQCSTIACSCARARSASSTLKADSAFIRAAASFSWPMLTNTSVITTSAPATASRGSDSDPRSLQRGGRRPIPFGRREPQREAEDRRRLAERAAPCWTRSRPRKPASCPRPIPASPPP